MADIVTGKDSAFSEDRLVQRYNVDIANRIGNLLKRTLNMAWKYRDDGKLKSPTSANDCLLFVRDEQSTTFDPVGVTNVAVENFSAHADVHNIHAALTSVFSLAGFMNSYVDASAPWKM